MKVSFIQESIDSKILEYADPKNSSIFSQKENKNFKKFFESAYSDLDKVLKANNLKLNVSRDLSVLSILPKTFVGQIVIEHSQDPRAKDLYTIVPYGIRGSKSINDRLQDGSVLRLPDLKSKKG